MENELTLVTHLVTVVGRTKHRDAVAIMANFVALILDLHRKGACFDGTLTAKLAIRETGAPAGRANASTGSHVTWLLQGCAA